MTVESSTDTVKHYGVVGSVNIIESAMHSYEEYGAVSFLEVAKGRVVLQAGAEVEQLHFNAKTKAEFDNIKIAADPSVTLPVFSRDDDIIDDTDVLVVELQKDTNDDANTDTDDILIYQLTVLTEEAKNEIKQEIKEAGEAERVAEEKKEDVKAVVWNKTSGDYFDNLYDAFASVDTNGTKTTIVLLKNVSGVSNKNYEIAVGQNIVFDLNGHTMNTVAPEGNTAYAIQNKGTLTIKDSTDTKSDGTGKGKLELNALNPDLHGVPGFASNVITNYNTLIIKSGWIYNASSGSAAFAIDNDAENAQRNSSLTTDVVRLIIEGGKITSKGSSSIRMYLDTQAAFNSIISIDKAQIGSLWVQDNNGAENSTGTLSIKDSIFDSIKIGYYGVAENVNVEIKNSKINNLFHYSLDSSKTGNTLTLENNEFGGFLMDNEAKVLTNGTFKLVEGSEINIGWVGADGTYTPEQMQTMIDEYASQGIRCGEQYNDEAWWQGYANATAQKRFIENCLNDEYKLQDNGNGVFTVVAK